MFRAVSLLMAALVTMALIGCSKAPQQEMAASEAAMQAAMQAEADQYAPEAYQMAMDSLNAAKAAVQEQDSKFALFRSYGKSKEMFVSAQGLMEKAATDAVAEKERVRQEVMALMTQADSALAAASKALDSAPRGKGSKADIELIKNDLTAVQATLAEAGNDVTAGKFLTAKAKLESVLSGSQRIITEIEAAKARK